MSYAKAADLLRVAEMAMSRYEGISLTDLTEEFGCDHRTAQRMMRSFETVFPQVDIREDDDRRRLWHKPIRWLQSQGMRSDELMALGMAIKRAERDGWLTLNSILVGRMHFRRTVASTSQGHSRRTSSALKVCGILRSSARRNSSRRHHFSVHFATEALIDELS